MRIATVLSALTAVALSVGAGALQAQSGQIQATATVLTAITVTGTNPLAFGNVTQYSSKVLTTVLKNTSTRAMQFDATY